MRRDSTSLTYLVSPIGISLRKCLCNKQLPFPNSSVSKILLYHRAPLSKKIRKHTLHQFSGRIQMLQNRWRLYEMRKMQTSMLSFWTRSSANHSTESWRAISGRRLSRFKRISNGGMGELKKRLRLKLYWSERGYLLKQFCRFDIWTYSSFQRTIIRIWRWMEVA